MIPKARLLTHAQDQLLPPTTIEKDYALGWILYGISQNAQASKWVFKGGTCLKKCFFNTYRFSEDLDFTIPPDEPYEHAAILLTLREIASWVESEAGIQFPSDTITLEEYTNPRNKTSFTGRAAFVGPLQMNRHSHQRVKFDISSDEILVDAPSPREIDHPYEDKKSPTPQVLCYSVNEILAEKSRALFERQGRARDVYDVVHLSRAFRETVDVSTALNILKQKFDFKGLPTPSVDTIMNRIDVGILTANWEQQLAHQLPVLPDVGGFVGGLRDSLLWWIEPANATPEALASIPVRPNEEMVERSMFPTDKREHGGPRGPSLSRITYGARNRLLVQIQYHGVNRLVEPYSLRHPATGNTLLYVWEVERGRRASAQLKSFILQNIESVGITDRPFTPRYRIEL